MSGNPSPIPGLPCFLDDHLVLQQQHVDYKICMDAGVRIQDVIYCDEDSGSCTAIAGTSIECVECYNTVVSHSYIFFKKMLGSIRKQVRGLHLHFFSYRGMQNVWHVMWDVPVRMHIPDLFLPLSDSPRFCKPALCL